MKFMIPLLFLLLGMTASAVASECDEVADSIRDQQRWADVMEQNCGPNGYDTSICAEAAVRTICNYNGLSNWAGELGRACYVRNGAGLSKLLEPISRYSDKLKQMVQNGDMKNPVDMPKPEMRRYCRSHHAVVP
jgi:hypothetical protein